MISERFRRAFHDYQPLLVVSLVYALVTLGVALSYGVSPYEILKIAYSVGISFMLALSFLMLMYFYAFFHLIVKTGTSGVVKRHDAVCAAYVEGQVFAWGCVALLATLAVNFFLIAKSLVPVIHPYGLDPLFAEWDRIIHFGHYPHIFLIAFIDYLHLGNFLDFSYASWFVVMYGFLAYSVFIDARLDRRLRFLWTYILSWILLGSAAAVMLSSVGPLFFANFYPLIPNPYADLLAHHEKMAKAEIPFITAVTRSLLIEWTQNDRMLDPNAISAMPSMHVAMAWLFMLYARHINKTAFVGAGLFFLLILLSSVYLGFHYAIDAYFSILAVSLIWGITGIFPGIRAAKEGAA